MMGDIEENVYLNSLVNKYANKEVYTNAGDLLIAIKPNFNANLHGTSALDKFKPGRQAIGEAHIFGLAADTALEGSGNQCIIIRGDSGSGKTKAVKYLFNYWSHYFSPSSQAKDKIMQIFPILESFTSIFSPKNNVTSKSIFTYNVTFLEGTICGIKINSFLQDKWRLTDQPTGESNFQIFYQVLCGMGHDLKNCRRRLLTDPAISAQFDAKMLRQKYEALVSSLAVLGFSAQEQSDVMLLVTMVLNLADVDFKRSKYNDIAVTDSSKPILQSFSDIVGLDCVELEEKLLTSSMGSSGREAKKEKSTDCDSALIPLLCVHG